MFGAVVLAAALLGAVDIAATWWLRLRIEGDPYATIATSLNNMVGFLWLYGLIAAVLVVIQSNRTVREREGQLADAREAAARAEADATAASLAALRYQLNPHLLFNALNAASSLVINRRNEEAEAMLAGIADFLRTALIADPQATVTLNQELATLDAYLGIETIRFGERLQVVVDCPPPLEDALLPGFLLQPLVENAIRYGVAPSRRTVTLRIDAIATPADLVLTVEDDGDPDKAANVSSGTGVGLANISKRLRVLYGDGAGLKTETLAGGFRASIHLPLAFAHDQDLASRK
jgi:LytS/YehU family sensor histidine kinase